MKMEAKRLEEEAERRKAKEMLPTFGPIAVVGLGILLVGVVVNWLVEHMSLFIGLLVAVFLCVITGLILHHKRKTRQQVIDILKTDVSKMGECEAERLAKKYQEK